MTVLSHFRDYFLSETCGSLLEYTGTVSDRSVCTARSALLVHVKVRYPTCSMFGIVYEMCGLGHSDSSQPLQTVVSHLSDSSRTPIALSSCVGNRGKLMTCYENLTLLVLFCANKLLFHATVI